jgi:hypothetical protein
LNDTGKVLRSVHPYRPIETSFVQTLMPNIQVLLATFNGQAYLEHQLTSLFAQDWPHFSILASDDDSSDDTLAMLKRWQSQAGKLDLLPTLSRSGPMNNFARLMQASTAPYVAFCDQDDLWDNNKLSLSMECMLNVERRVPSGTPVLVYSDLRLIDEFGNLLDTSLWQKARVRPANADFNNMLAQNLVTGCSMLANRALLDLALPLPDAAIMHDYWLALAASAFGIASPVPRPTLSYRQHASNTIGAGKALTLPQRVRRLFVDPELSAWLPAAAAQARAFTERFGSRLTSRQSAALNAMAEINTRSAITRPFSLVRHGIVRTEPLNHLQFMLRLAFGNTEAKSE